MLSRPNTKLKLAEERPLWAPVKGVVESMIRTETKWITNSILLEYYKKEELQKILSKKKPKRMWKNRFPITLLPRAIRTNTRSGILVELHRKIVVQWIAFQRS